MSGFHEARTYGLLKSCFILSRTCLSWGLQSTEKVGVTRVEKKMSVMQRVVSERDSMAAGPSWCVMRRYFNGGKR